MVINLGQRKIKIKLVWNHFNPKFILNYNIDITAKSFLFKAVRIDYLFKTIDKFQISKAEKKVY